MKRIEGIYAVFEEQRDKYYFVEQKPESIIYVKELECNMMCGKRKVNCNETCANDANMRFFRFEALLNLIYQLCKENKCMQKRFISYAYDDFFKRPESIDPILNSICAMIGCTRHNLNIMSSSKDKFIGDVNFQYHGDEKINGANNEAVNIMLQSIDRVTFMHPANSNGQIRFH
ncbi:hypothetical protein M0R45_003830 [Rubus argutus]|uniref:Spo11/DNA topoisomerase VI subunit A N-terminal domain-containing protein n=1 Tax=Rubus argutus TaxID=59490 RepID=A0AAW1YG49_RUBAR